MLAEYGDQVAEYDEIDRARLLFAYTRRQKFNARLIVGQLAEAMGGGGPGPAPVQSQNGYGHGYRQVEPATLFAIMGTRFE